MNYWVVEANDEDVEIEKVQYNKTDDAVVGYVLITLTKDGAKDTIYKFNFEVDGEFTNTYSYTGKAQEFTAIRDGYYEIELWGAQGNNHPTRGFAEGGRGAYTKGTIYLKKGQKLYVYVGQHRTDSGSATSWNAGSTGGTSSESYDISIVNGYGGGGATDVRLVPASTDTTWNESKSLASRIMVAAGGGGANEYRDIYEGASNGGAGGALVGKTGSSHGCAGYVVNIPSTGGTQTSGGTNGRTGGSNGYQSGYAGGFGIGGNAQPSYGSGGGGGYWGGYGSGHTSCVVDSAPGGSSFISGYTGAVAIKSETDTSPRLSNKGEVCATGDDIEECSYHYSGFIFNNAEMLAGDEYIPSYDGTGKKLGNTGNGYAKISFVDELSQYANNITTNKGDFNEEFDKIKSDYTITVESDVEEIELIVTNLIQQQQ